MGRNHATGPLCVLGLCASILLASETQGWAVETATENFVAKASTINGNGGNPQAYSYLALATFNQSLFAGTITSVTSNSIISAGADWTQNAFNGTNGAHYVEFENGALADIVLSDAAAKSLTIPGSLPTGVSPGDSFQVRKHVTIADIFGPNNEAGLLEGLNANQADNILLSFPESQESFTLFYANIPGFEGWYYFDYQQASDAIVYPEQGLIIRRRGGADITLFTEGVSRQGPTRIPVFSGYNLVSTVRSSGSMTLDELNLYTGNPDTGIASGNNPNIADNVILIGPNQTSSRYFYLNIPGFTGWYDSSYAPANDVSINAGEAFFIYRKSQRPWFQWDIPSE